MMDRQAVAQARVRDLPAEQERVVALQKHLDIEEKKFDRQVNDFLRYLIIDY
jgi:hypothetical protein